MGDRTVRTSFSRGDTIATTATVGNVIVSGRARQLIHLTGYRFGFHVRASVFGQSDNDFLSLAAQLQPSGRDWGVSVSVLLGTNGVGRKVGHPIDVQYWHGTQEVRSSVGIEVQRANKDSGWVNCDLLLPEVGLYMVQEHTRQVVAEFWATVEYDWRNADLAMMAAVNFAWGRDPQDFDRGEGI